MKTINQFEINGTDVFIHGNDVSKYPYSENAASCKSVRKELDDCINKLDNNIEKHNKTIDEFQETIDDFQDSITNQINSYKPIEITGDVVNAPDEEDLTSTSDNLLQLKDRNNLNGMGYIILRQNKSFAEQLTQTNTIYEIRYDFDLNGEQVTIPENCVLKFDGGTLNNGDLIGNKTRLYNGENCFGPFLELGGWREWENVSVKSFQHCHEDIGDVMNKIRGISGHIEIPAGVYNALTTVELLSGDNHITGSSDIYKITEICYLGDSVFINHPPKTSHTIIENLSIYGKGTPSYSSEKMVGIEETDNQQVGLYLNQTRNVVIRNVKFQHLNVAIHSTAQSWSHYFESIHCAYNNYGILVDAGSEYNNIHIMQSTFHGNEYGIRILPIGCGRFINNSHIEGNNYGIICCEQRDVHITNNYIERNYINDISIIWGFSSGASGNHLCDISNNMIMNTEDSNSYRNKKHSIVVEASSCKLSIINNMFYVLGQVADDYASIYIKQAWIQPCLIGNTTTAKDNLIKFESNNYGIETAISGIQSNAIIMTDYAKKQYTEIGFIEDSAAVLCFSLMSYKDKLPVLYTITACTSYTIQQVQATTAGYNYNPQYISLLYYYIDNNRIYFYVEEYQVNQCSYQCLTNNFHETMIELDELPSGSTLISPLSKGTLTLGTEAEVPPEIIPTGYHVFSEALNRPVYWYGGKWLDAIGAESHLSKQGTLEQRPDPQEQIVPVGYLYIQDTKPIWWTGTEWVDANGNNVDTTQTETTTDS